ncbi:hypothetical protein [Methylococcus sp. Mc7]|uniref:hypothetical protein n=1 Tax=Methylococcus sp. Mc7 TaxID=2860258 RepID=UPI001C530030|nr:hypothetical protein [Methylococcus sp. Mc7]QXP85658.1 hypothetical protein KW115_08120 [Methylococcus sp. Mc7]
MSLMISMKYFIELGRNKTLFLASFLLSAMPQAFADTIRILPLGDSITQGGRKDRPEYSYRYDRRALN